jgi:2-polyprenyl-3-methyl-5-hydroxy-6-metoxy-1,4-benzoquinol methylase
MLCHVCAKALKSRFAEVADSQTGETFSILACDDCGLAQTSPVPDDLNFYYADYHGGRHGATANFCAARRVRWLERSVAENVNPPRKVLDIGCGEGTFLQSAKRRGWQTVGVELSRAGLSDSNLEIHETIAAVKDAHGENSFAAITLWHVLEHLKNPREILKEIDELLASGGKLLIAVPDAAGFQAAIFGADWLHLDVPRHLYHFNSESLETLLKQCGFLIEHSRHLEFEYDLLGWSQSALNKIFSPPNIFFQTLTNRKTETSRVKLAANVAFGIAFSAMVLPLIPLGSLMKKGGTIIVEASKAQM